MNDLQKLYSAISGYGLSIQDNGAHDEFYYENCETKYEKIQQLRDYSNNFLDMHLTESDLVKVYEALERANDATDSSEIYHNFESLV